MNGLSTDYHVKGSVSCQRII